MATAGLASMFLVFDMYHGKTPYQQSQSAHLHHRRRRRGAQIDRTRHGLARQVARATRSDGYYLYGIERTGVASGRKLIGGEDWFARALSPSCKASSETGPFRWASGAATWAAPSFCTLFLVYGGAPVAVNKLQYGKGQDWNLNPRDLANLSKALWSAYERPDQLADRFHRRSRRGDRGADPVPVRLEEGRVHREGNAEAARVHRARRHHRGRAERSQQADFAASMERPAQGHVSAAVLPQRAPGGAAGRAPGVHSRSSTSGRIGRSCAAPATGRGPSS